MTPFFRALSAVLFLAASVAAQTPVDASATTDESLSYEATLDLPKVLLS